MVKIITNFNEFIDSNFNTISLGLTPSGNLHLGFLTTLACAFLYLKYNPRSKLIITTLENTLDANIVKYNNLPIRFQYLSEDGKLEVPENLNQINEKRVISKKVTAEIKDLIWKLVQIFDNKTKEEISAIRKYENLSKTDKNNLLKKQNSIFHLFSNNIYVYSLLDIFEKNKNFRRDIAKILTNPEDIIVINKLAGLDSSIKNFGKPVIADNKKEYQAKFQSIPIRIFCPECKYICNEWGKVVYGHPEFGSPKFVSTCKNKNNCSLAKQEKLIVLEPREDMNKIELYFLLGIIRDFYKPFKADCRVFGGDYFQIQSLDTGKSTAERLSNTVNYFEKKTGQSKTFFGGPLITIDGKKMSKTNVTFHVKDIENITKSFINIVKMLEKLKLENISQGIQLDYREILN